MNTQTTLHLYKENFKFSSAHFLIFDEKNAEKLHGHNYRVRVSFSMSEASFGEKGYSVDFNIFKKAIKARLDQWDEHVLLPVQHPDIKTSVEGSSLKLNFRDRFYVFPKNEVVLLPIHNTSVERLSELLAKEFLSEFSKLGVSAVEVQVEETSGQAASTRYAVPVS